MPQFNYGKFMASTSNLQNTSRNGNPQARYWLGTIHHGHLTNSTVESWSPPTMLPTGVLWMRGQKEVGEGGTLHIQLFVSFAKKVRLNTVKATIGNGHWEPSRSDHAEQYVWKEETRVPDTQFELGQKAFQRNNPTDWARIKDLAKSNKIDQLLEEEPEITIRHYRTLKQIGVDHLQCPGALPGPCGKWVYGPPGVGKSFWVRQQWGSDLYIKAQNKWWDGYKGQKFVLLDDFDCKALGHYLKIWTDAYAFTAETKGGTIQIRPDVFIITSNYKPEEIFDDPILAEAVSRRCQRIFIPMRRY